MGAWGPAIFSDDLACDIRGDYRELLEDEVPDDEACRRVIESYRHLDPDEERVLWLALAATQSSLGRLDEHVRERALEVIDTGRGLELWKEAGPRELAKRKAALSELRDQLTSLQPARKTVRRPWRYVTDLEPGDVLSFTASNNAVAVLRVARVDEHRVNVAPIIQWLDWDGHTVPAGRKLRRLKVRRDRKTVVEGLSTFGWRSTVSAIQTGVTAGSRSWRGARLAGATARRRRAATLRGAGWPQSSSGN